MAEWGCATSLLAIGTGIGSSKMVFLCIGQFLFQTCCLYFQLSSAFQIPMGIAVYFGLRYENGLRWRVTFPFLLGQEILL